MSAVNSVFDFVLYCAEQGRLNILPPAAIANMDETAIWADMPGNTTVEKIGATSVPLLTTGHEKERITVCLSALASGEKLKPFIVFRGKRFPNELNNIQGAIIMLSPNGWMNETLTAEWIKQIWGPRQTNKRMLVINTTFLHACMYEESSAKHKYDNGCSSWGQRKTDPTSQCEQECPPSRLHIANHI